MNDTHVHKYELIKDLPKSGIVKIPKDDFDKYDSFEHYLSQLMGNIIYTEIPNTPMSDCWIYRWNKEAKNENLVSARSDFPIITNLDIGKTFIDINDYMKPKPEFRGLTLKKYGI